MSERISPFSNGSQYMDWEASNCASCSKAATEEQWDKNEFPCSIQSALFVASWGDGEVSDEFARRMGYHRANNEDGFSYVWPCLEHDPPFEGVEP